LVCLFCLGRSESVSYNFRVTEYMSWLRMKGPDWQCFQARHYKSCSIFKGRRRTEESHDFQLRLQLSYTLPNQLNFGHISRVGWIGIGCNCSLLDCNCVRLSMGLTCLSRCSSMWIPSEAFLNCLSDCTTIEQIVKGSRWAHLLEQK